jgi:hypothetical protein
MTERSQRSTITSLTFPGAIEQARDTRRSRQHPQRLSTALD